MKKYLLFTILSALFFTNIHSQELDVCPSNTGNFYVKAFSGLNYFDSTGKCSGGYKIKNQNGYAVSGTLGYRINNGLRIEGEYIYKKNNLKLVSKSGYYSSKRKTIVVCKSSTLMTNLVYELPIYNIFKSINIQPLIGAGIGCEFINSSYRYISRYFSWQAITGLKYNMTKKTEISLEYKLFNWISSKTSYNHTIGLGLTYHFGYRDSL